MALLLTPLQAFEQTASIQHHMFLRFLHSCTWLIRQRKEFPFLEGPPPLPTMAISFSEQTNSTKGLPSSLTILLLGKMVNIVPHTTLSKKIKVILERSPIDLPFQRLTDLSYVVTVTRCVARCTKEKTWQVLFVTNKSLSAEINLGTFETSQAWEYISETLRCFKCQRFSYHQTKCVASPLCAICAQPNAMEDCLAKHNAGEKTTIMHWTSVVKRGGHFYPWVLQYNESSQKKIHDWNRSNPRRSTTHTFASFTQNEIRSLQSLKYIPLHATITPSQQSTSMLQNPYSMEPVTNISLFFGQHIFWLSADQ